MRPFTVFTIALCSILLTACDPQVFEGTMVFDDDFVAGQNNTIVAGEYRTKVKVLDEDEIRVVLKEANNDGSDKYINLETPEDLEIPEGTMSFRYSAAELKLPFGIEGDVHTRYTDGPDQVEWEPCRYNCGGGNCGPWGCSGPRECHGMRRVVYFERDIDRELTFLMTNESSNATAAYAGEQRGYQRVYRQQGFCR